MGCLIPLIRNEGSKSFKKSSKIVKDFARCLRIRGWECMIFNKKPANGRLETRGGEIPAGRQQPQPPCGCSASLPAGSHRYLPARRLRQAGSRLETLVITHIFPCAHLSGLAVPGPQTPARGWPVYSNAPTVKIPNPVGVTCRKLSSLFRLLVVIAAKNE